MLHAILFQQGLQHLIALGTTDRDP